MLLHRNTYCGIPHKHLRVGAKYLSDLEEIE
jgi:hypothetical protein